MADSEIVELLLSLSDFTLFKEAMLAHKKVSMSLCVYAVVCLCRCVFVLLCVCVVVCLCCCVSVSLCVCVVVCLCRCVSVLLFVCFVVSCVVVDVLLALLVLRRYLLCWCVERCCGKNDPSCHCL